VARYGAGDEEIRRPEMNVSGAAMDITVAQRFDSFHPTSAVADLGNLDPGTARMASAQVLVLGSRLRSYG